MTLFRFRAIGKHRKVARLLRQRFGIRSALSSKVLAATAAASATLYVINQPGDVLFDSPRNLTYTDAAEVIVSGTIERVAVRELGLEVDGRVYDAAASDGKFSGRVPLRLGKNTIRPVLDNLGAHVLNHSADLVLYAVKNPGPITFISPLHGETVASSSITVSGHVALSKKVDDHHLRQIEIQVSSPDVEHAHTVSVPISNRRFRATLPLRVGENTLRGLESARLENGSQPINIYRVHSPGRIEIMSPTDGQILRALTHDVHGRVENPDVKSVNLAINGELRSVSILRDGKFSFPQVQLRYGMNEITAYIRGAPREVVRPIAPTILHQFEHGDDGWLLAEGEFDARPPWRTRSGYPSHCLEFQDVDAAPLDVVFVIDTSDSMGERLQVVKAKAAEIIRSLKVLNDDVRIGLVQFATGASVRLPLTKTNERTTPDIISAIGFAKFGLADSGDDQYLGIAKALHMDWRTTRVSKAIILITDEGAANGPKSFGRLDYADHNLNESLRKLVAKDLTPEALKKRAGEIGIRFFAIIVGKEETALADAKKLLHNKNDDILQSSDSELVQRIVQAANYAGETYDLGRWQAPRSVVLAMKQAMGMTLSFDIMQEASQGQLNSLHADDVRLVSEISTLSYRFDDVDRDPNQWQSFEVSLTDDAGWIDEKTRVVAGAGKLAATLSRLTKLQIRADFRAGPEITAIDNFRITGRGTSESTAITSTGTIPRN